MCIVGTVTFISSYFQMFCFSASGEYQSKRIREAYFKSVISQDIEFFDRTATGDLTNRLSADMNLVQEGLSDKVC